MSQFTFKPATKTKAKARISLTGPSGSGKTYSALLIARGLGDRIALVDTERGSASKYAGEIGVDFDVLELERHHPNDYIAAIDAAAEAGYDVLIIDSLSHAWAGREGALELVDRATKRLGTANSFQAWGEITPLHNLLVDAIVGAPLHIIATMRSKTEYVIEAVEKNGRTINVPRKVGTAPVQRQDTEYEFDIVADLRIDHTLVVSKTRCRTLDGATIAKPGVELGVTVRQWLDDGYDPLDDWRADADAAESSGSLKAFLGPDGLQARTEFAPAFIRAHARETVDAAMCRTVVAHVDQLDRDQCARVRKLVDDARANGDRDRALAAIDSRLGALVQPEMTAAPALQDDAFELDAAGFPVAEQLGLDPEPV